VTVPRIVVMGVSGSGKSTVGAALATRLGIGFVDGDALHPAANVAKMHAGVPLDDADRWPWLDAVAGTLAASETGVVVACSALKRAYRDHIRQRAGGCRFLYLAAPERVAHGRVAGRRTHFMPGSLVASQYATLEPPAPDEGDVLTVDATRPVAELLSLFTGWSGVAASG
jgi:carbohydrate kinase (thermoresistant glucokinase family)